MLSRTQFLIFELGTECNLGHVHKRCPNQHPERYSRLDTSRELHNSMIIECAVSAYLDHGFTGLIGWHYYNEPTLQAARMSFLMRSIKDRVDTARFVLWSNGANVSDYIADKFHQVHITDYIHDPQGSRLDDRLIRKIAEPNDNRPCMRPFTEFIIDNYGNHHPCCYDWRGEGSLGNVFTANFAILVERWSGLQDAVAGREMMDDAPTACKACGRRTQAITRFDHASAQRAEEWRAGL